MFNINVEGFLNTLPIMAKGMLGIFVVTIIFIGVIYCMNLISKKKK